MADCGFSDCGFGLWDCGFPVSGKSVPGPPCVPFTFGSNSFITSILDRFAIQRSKKRRLFDERFRINDGLPDQPFEKVGRSRRMPLIVIIEISVDGSDPAA